MTDIIVPSELIVALKERYPSLAAGASNDHPVRAIVSLLPDPPKVGDTITSADGLPVGTVLRDNVGDIWFVGPDESLSFLRPRENAPKAFPIFNPSWQSYEPVIISLPRD